MAWLPGRRGWEVGLFWAQETPKPGSPGHLGVVPEPAVCGLFGPTVRTLQTLRSVPRWWENHYQQPRHPVPPVPPPSSSSSLYGVSLSPACPRSMRLALATVPYQASLSVHPNLLSAYRTFRCLRILFLDPQIPQIPRRYNLTTAIPCPAAVVWTQTLPCCCPPWPFWSISSS